MAYRGCGARQYIEFLNLRRYQPRMLRRSGISYESPRKERLALFPSLAKTGNAGSAGSVDFANWDRSQLFRLLRIGQLLV